MHKHDACERPKLHDVPANELKEQMKLANISIKGNVHDLRKCCKNVRLPIPLKRKNSELAKEYVGLSIGLTELLWRRGYSDPSESKLRNYKQRLKTAKNTSAFTNELSELEINMKKVHVEVILIPKGNCEIVGRGM